MNTPRSILAGILPVADAFTQCQLLLEPPAAAGGARIVLPLGTSVC